MIGTSTQGSSAHETLARAAHDERTGVIRSFYGNAARLDHIGFGMLRLGLVIVPSAERFRPLHQRTIQDVPSANSQCHVRAQQQAVVRP